MSTNDSQPNANLVKAIKLEKLQNGSVSSASGVNETPTIPLHIIDAPSQRLYACGAIGLLQSIKLFYLLDIGLFSNSKASTPLYSWFLWSFLDSLLIFSLYKLKIPRLQFSPQIWLLAIAIIFIINSFLSLSISQVIFYIDFYLNFTNHDLDSWAYFLYP
jgi:hypothetical protein